MSFLKKLNISIPQFIEIGIAILVVTVIDRQIARHTDRVSFEFIILVLVVLQVP